MPGVDTDTVRDISAALDDMLAKYPHTKILSVEISNVEGDIAQALEDVLRHNGVKGTRILFSERYATDRNLLSTAVRDAVQRGHFNSMPAPPAYGAIVHEFGHALSFSGRSAAVDSADSDLLEHYLRTDGSRLSGGDIMESYRIWRGQLNGYSFWRGEFDPIEALPEAFTDVELNGGSASEPAQVLFRTLVDAAESQWRRVGLM
ncbi:hypothetical protein AB0C34_06250 [Nocardia sp. NPDC049220]|uniref:hypothetical protein n=1 Tax=Nocardia sp. NPDC049220 TaxID=3155273 RepID=UPI0033F6DAE0